MHLKNVIRWGEILRIPYTVDFLLSQFLFLNFNGLQNVYVYVCGWYVPASLCRLENAWCLCQDCWRIPWRFRLWRISHIHTHSFRCLSTRPSAPWLLGIPHLPDRKPVRIPNCYCPLQNWSSPSSALVVNDIGAPCSIGDRTEPDRWHQHCWQLIGWCKSA